MFDRVRNAPLHRALKWKKFMNYDWKMYNLFRSPIMSLLLLLFSLCIKKSSSSKLNLLAPRISESCIFALHFVDSKVFMKVLKPFETPQRSVKIKIEDNFLSLRPGSGQERVRSDLPILLLYQFYFWYQTWIFNMPYFYIQIDLFAIVSMHI